MLGTDHGACFTARSRLASTRKPGDRIAQEEAHTHCLLSESARADGTGVPWGCKLRSAEPTSPPLAILAPCTTVPPIISGIALPYSLRRMSTQPPTSVVSDVRGPLQLDVVALLAHRYCNIRRHGSLVCMTFVPALSLPLHLPQKFFSPSPLPFPPGDLAAVCNAWTTNAPLWCPLFPSASHQPTRPFNTLLGQNENK